MADGEPSPDTIKKTVSDLLDRMRNAAPRVHCLTNTVAQNLTANCLLALGAEPSMTISTDEIGNFVMSSDAVLINLGTLDADRRASAVIAAETARGSGTPFVLDPVFAHRSTSRAALAEKILALDPYAMRGNAEELAGLAKPGNSTVLAQTGSEDLVSLKDKTARLRNGSHYMAKTTAMGCALGGVIAACLAVEEDRFLAVCSALHIFGVAGEMAEKKADGPGSFVPAFLDALYQLDRSDIDRLGQVS